jgi:hypothetical protein
MMARGVFISVSCHVDKPITSRLEMDWLLPVARKGEVWREGRKILDRSLRPGSTMAYRQMMHENIRGFLARVLVTPKDFLDHIRLSVIVVLYILPSLTAMKPPGKTYHVPHVWI